MLLYPAIDKLKSKVDSKYTLAILASKRARDIIDGKPQLTLTDSNKPLSVATCEVAEDLISYTRPSEEVAEAAADEELEIPETAETEAVSDAE